MTKILGIICGMLLIACLLEAFSIKVLNDDLKLKEVELSSCQTSTKSCKQSNEIKTVVTTVNNDTCQSQIDNLRKTEEKYKKANSDLMKLYEESKRKANAVPMIINNPVEDENSYEKDKAVSEYLDAVVPRDVERMSRARSHSTN